jgi:hypothetical protein
MNFSNIFIIDECKLRYGVSNFKSMLILIGLLLFLVNLKVQWYYFRFLLTLTVLTVLPVNTDNYLTFIKLFSPDSTHPPSSPSTSHICNITEARKSGLTRGLCFLGCGYEECFFRPSDFVRQSGKKLPVLVRAEADLKCTLKKRTKFE